MTTKSLVVAAIGAATVVAAGAGTFMASRMGPVAPQTTTSAAPPVAAPPAAVIGTSVAVEQPAPRADEPIERPPAREPRTKTDAPLVSRASCGTGSSGRAGRPDRDGPDRAGAGQRHPSGCQPNGSSHARDGAAARRRSPASGAAETALRGNHRQGRRGDSAFASRMRSPQKPRASKIAITARDSRDVTVEGRTAIPAGSLLEGTVTMVERGEVQGSSADRHSIHDARARRELAAADSDRNDLP